VGGSAGRDVALDIATRYALGRRQFGTDDEREVLLMTIWYRRRLFRSSRGRTRCPAKIRSQNP
jgi:hypothetical protein